MAAGELQEQQQAAAGQLQQQQKSSHGSSRVVTSAQVASTTPLLTVWKSGSCSVSTKGPRPWRKASTNTDRNGMMTIMAM